MLPTIAAIVLLTILLLAIPVHLVFALKKDGIWRGRIVVYWLFGLTRRTLRPGREDRARVLRRRRRRRKVIGAASRQVVSKRRHVFAVLRSKGFARRAAYLVRDLLRSIRPRRFRFQCVVGLDDPADTGRLLAVLSPLRLLANTELKVGRHSQTAFELIPDFTGPRCAGYWYASVRFVPLTVIGLFLGFLFSPPVFRAAMGLLQKPGA